MLTLTLKPGGGGVTISTADGDIYVCIKEIKHDGKVKVMFDAPRIVPILRDDAIVREPKHGRVQRPHIGRSACS